MEQVGWEREGERLGREHMGRGGEKGGIVREGRGWRRGRPYMEALREVGERGQGNGEGGKGVE